MGPVSRDSDVEVRPLRSARISAQIDIAISAGARAPMSSPARAVDASKCLLTDAQASKPVESAGLCPA